MAAADPSDEPEERPGLPPPRDVAPPPPTPRMLWGARGVNLIGLVSPAANLGMVALARREHRWFGVGAGFVCSIVLVWASGAGVAWLAWTAAVVHYALVVLGLLDPRWPEAVARAWIRFGSAIGHVMSYPVLGLAFFLVVTPTALVMRLLGKDPLRRNAPPSDTYWTPHVPPSKERYQRQF